MTQYLITACVHGGDNWRCLHTYLIPFVPLIGEEGGGGVGNAQPSQLGARRA